MTKTPAGLKPLLDQRLMMIPEYETNGQLTVTTFHQVDLQALLHALQWC